jgi:hypothetical protein
VVLVAVDPPAPAPQLGPVVPSIRAEKASLAAFVHPAGAEQSSFQLRQRRVGKLQVMTTSNT